MKKTLVLTYGKMSYVLAVPEKNGVEFTGDLIFRPSFIAKVINTWNSSHTQTPQRSAEIWRFPTCGE
jgi:hypothetical protein